MLLLVIIIMLSQTRCNAGETQRDSEYTEICFKFTEAATELLNLKLDDSMTVAQSLSNNEKETLRHELGLLKEQYDERCIMLFALQVRECCFPNVN